jgi:hypothetical protein
MLSSKGSSAVMPNLDDLCCYRELWVTYDLTYVGNPDGPKLDEVTARRHCEGFLRYHPGLPPVEHMQRLSKSEERKAQFRNLLLASVLGSILTLVGQWAAKHLGLK